MNKETKDFTFDLVNFCMEAVNGLIPKREQPEENYIQYPGEVLFSTYKCKTCGQEQKVLINPQTHKPYGNPKCFNSDCDNYGYSKDWEAMYKKSNKISPDRILVHGFENKYSDLVAVVYLDDKNLLCINTASHEFIILNEEVIGKLGMGIEQ